jgi:hypothetical protein
MNADLGQFVREALARGVAREQVRSMLLAARWRGEEIDAALAAWADGEPGLPVPRRRLSLSAREAFQHLVLFATLYIFTFDVGALLFVLIESRLRDVALDARGGGLDVLRWSTAGAVTALPIFLWMNHMVGRSLMRDPEKRASGVRRWLTYLTLFVAALVLIGNFSTVVSNLLAGGLSLRFMLKSLVVFAIAGLVFGHYLLGLRREEAEADARPRAADWLGRVGVGAAVVAILAGLFTGGAPHDARLRQLDERRLNDLLEIDRNVNLFHGSRRVLPASLDQLDLAGIGAPSLTDPVTGARYGYVIVDSITYRVSATFATADTLRPSGESIARSWRHGAGRQWFTRTVTPGFVPGR